MSSATLSADAWATYWYHYRARNLSRKAVFISTCWMRRFVEAPAKGITYRVSSPYWIKYFLKIDAYDLSKVPWYVSNFRACLFQFLLTTRIQAIIHIGLKPFYVRSTLSLQFISSPYYTSNRLIWAHLSRWVQVVCLVSPCWSEVVCVNYYNLTWGAAFFPGYFATWPAPIRSGFSSYYSGFSDSSFRLLTSISSSDSEGQIGATASPWKRYLCVIICCPVLKTNSMTFGLAFITERVTYFCFPVPFTRFLLWMMISFPKVSKLIRRMLLLFQH